MKLFFDENLSPRLVARVASEFPGSIHVESVGFRGRADAALWEYARAEGLTLVSKDNDFRQLSFLLGPPPKVVWLSVGNAPTDEIVRLILDRAADLRRFDADPEAGLLVLGLREADDRRG